MKAAIYLSLLFLWGMSLLTLSTGIKLGVAGVMAFLVFAGASYVVTKTSAYYIKNVIEKK